MTKNSRSSNDNSLFAHGGGNATASGVIFQAKLGAFFTSFLLAERRLVSNLTGEKPLSIRFETEAPVDDILVSTAIGNIFIQVKNRLTLSNSPNSELAKTAEQFVRQWLACSTGNGDRNWNKPLHPDRDRLLLAVGPNAPKTLTTTLAEGLDAHQSTRSAPLTKAQLSAVETFCKHLRREWKKFKGQQATDQDIDSICNLVKIQVYDFDGEIYCLAAKELLTNVLNSSDEAETAFSAIAQYCVELMSNRGGCSMSELRRELTARGISLAATPSYQEDVQKLRNYSKRVSNQLSELEAISVNGGKVRVERRCTKAVVEAARTASFLITGEPGAGKSGVISASANILKEERYDVITLAVDRLPVNSLFELSSELGLCHPLLDVLSNWPNDHPAILIIDALDATRGGNNEVVFRTLISDLLLLDSNSWNVIASIRTFDLQLGYQFKRLFEGKPQNAEFAHTEFSKVSHINVSKWTPEEFNYLLLAAPKLAVAIETGGERLRELVQVPFNTRLLADLISNDLLPTTLGEIRSQVQLLNLYWQNRVIKHGTVAELCLRTVVWQMIESRSLRTNKLNAANSNPEAFDALLFENVLVLPQQQFVTFRHHILFDYAASRVFLQSDDLKNVVKLFSKDNNIGLMLAPALAFVLQQLWDDIESGRQTFWDAIVKISGDPECDPIARSVAARLASELPSVNGEAIGLLAGLTEHGRKKDQVKTAISHVIGALIVRLDDKKELSLDPWFELVEHSSNYIDETVWALKALLYALSERTSSKADETRYGLASRRFLKFCLDENNDVAQLVPSGISFVADTYKSEIAESRQLLSKLLEPDHFQNHADQELRWLALGLKTISEVDPEFVVDIFITAFRTNITDRSTTHISNSQILSLRSNRRQDFDSSLWTLKEFFPDFFEEHPIHAVQALIGAISGYIERENRIDERAQTWSASGTFGKVQLQEDRSHIWAWNVDKRNVNNALSLVLAFVNFIEAAEPEQAEAVVQEIINKNKLGILWARTFMVASKRAEVVGHLLWPIATQEPFIVSNDTRKDAIDFIAARYPFESITSRQVFERTVLNFKFDQFKQSDEARIQVLKKLFSQVENQHLATDEIRQFVTDEIELFDSISTNPRPFSVVVENKSMDSWWLDYIEESNESPEIIQFLTQIDNVKDTVLESEIEDITATIKLVNSFLDFGDLFSANLPDNVAQYQVFGIAAQIASNLSRLPIERLQKKHHSLPSLITLIERLSRIPWSAPTDSDEANFELSGSWGSPDTRVETANAIMGLCRINKETVNKFRPTIKTFLDVVNVPAARMEIAAQLTVLWNTDRHYMWKLANHIARYEPNRNVLRFFVTNFLGSLLNSEPKRVENLTFIIHRRKFDRKEEATQQLLEESGKLITIIWLRFGSKDPLHELKSWIANPLSFETELTGAIGLIGDVLDREFQNADTNEVEITSRAQEFCNWTVNVIADELEEYYSQTQKGAQSDIKNERGVYFARFAKPAMSRNLHCIEGIQIGRKQ